MVLKYIIIFSLLSLCSKSTNGPLLSQYRSKIKKEITSKLDLNKSEYTLENIDIDKQNIEVYSIFTQSNVTGYAFIKEVKACSLNGCISSKPNTDDDDTGSEYYDIFVLTDMNKNIKSIKVLDYFSDYGYEITSKRYLKKYIGASLCQFSSSQDTKIPVDGISGATISYNALVTTLGECCDLTAE